MEIALAVAALLWAVIAFLFGRRSARKDQRDTLRRTIYEGPLHDLRTSLRDVAPGALSEVWVARNRDVVERLYRQVVALGAEEERLASELSRLVFLPDARRHEDEMRQAVDDLDGALYRRLRRR